MSMLWDKLERTLTSGRIPNILFHGCHMDKIIEVTTEFLERIYQHDKVLIKAYSIVINCGQFKGIKFIREELNFFAKTYINTHTGLFKSIVLLNADKLTMDAQSALRRCIEIFSHTTRFFICVEDKYKILKPILSRCCEICISNVSPMTSSVCIPSRVTYLRNAIDTIITKHRTNVLSSISVDLYGIVTKLYNKAYSSNDLLQLLEVDRVFALTTIQRYELMFAFSKIKRDLRSEELLMFIMVYFITSVSNISTFTRVIL
jgi:hypothetical protein